MMIQSMSESDMGNEGHRQWASDGQANEKDRGEFLIRKQAIRLSISSSRLRRIVFSPVGQDIEFDPEHERTEE